MGQLFRCGRTIRPSKFAGLRSAHRDKQPSRKRRDSRMLGGCNTRTQARTLKRMCSGKLARGHESVNSRSAAVPFGGVRRPPAH